MGGDDDVKFRVDRIVRLSTGTMKVLLSAAAYESLKCSGTSSFPIEPFGDWHVSAVAPSPGRSAVIAGVPEHLTEQQVATELVEGSARELPENIRDQLQTLRVQRMAKRVRDGGSHPDEDPAKPGARKISRGPAPKFVTSRCCRIFASDALIEAILARGRMNLRWAMLPVRQYNPPTFYCGKCQRYGSHSTRFHRDLNFDHVR